jgi:hypothetical protein
MLQDADFGGVTTLDFELSVSTLFMDNIDDDNSEPWRGRFVSTAEPLLPSV